MSETRLSWTVAWGVTLGVFPILGVSTLACAMFAGATRQSHALIQAVNYATGPLKVLLILPCVRLGEFLFAPAKRFDLSLEEFHRLFALAPGETLASFAASFGHAVAGWLLIAPLFLFGSFFLTRSLFRAGNVQNLFAEVSS